MGILIYSRGRTASVRSQQLNWINVFFDRLKRSKHLHVRGTEVDSPVKAIDLVDRFIDDKLRYPLEWDDFISWKNSNRSVEHLREQLAALEPLFFSKDKTLRHQAVVAMIQLRNHYAKLLGIPSRDES
jgi:hypothetical protein